MTITIPGRLPGYNELTKGHWAARHQVKTHAMNLVALHMRAAGMKPITEHVTIEIRCYEPNARRDDDNVTSGAAKVILDAMQRIGILQGDGQKYVRCNKHPVEIDRANPHIDIVVTPTGKEPPNA